MANQGTQYSEGLWPQDNCKIEGGVDMELYKQVELKDGVLVQFVGVYVTRWQSEWGAPTVGFVRVDEDELREL